MEYCPGCAERVKKKNRKRKQDIAMLKVKVAELRQSLHDTEQRADNLHAVLKDTLEAQQKVTEARDEALRKWAEVEFALVVTQVALQKSEKERQKSELALRELTEDVIGKRVALIRAQRDESEARLEQAVALLEKFKKAGVRYDDTVLRALQKEVREFLRL